MPNQHPKEEPRVRKVYEIESKAASLKDNHIEGAAAAIGNMDRGGDVIFPGAFKKVTAQFLRDGFVPVGHNWEGLGVAMPISCKEQGRVLMAVAEFHSDPEAQAIRTRCMERMERGLSVGLSIGFSVDYTGEDGRMWFENGKAMAKYIEDAKLDQSLFDMAGIKKHADYCRAIFQIAELYEFSIVTVPMNPKATATQVKSVSLDGRSLNDLEFEDHSESVLTAVKEYVARAIDYKSLRDSKCRPLSQARRIEFESLRDEINALLKTVELDVPSDDDATLLALAQHEEWEARRMALI